MLQPKELNPFMRYASNNVNPSSSKAICNEVPIEVGYLIINQYQYEILRSFQMIGSYTKRRQL